MFCALVFQGLSGLLLGLGVFGVSVCVLDVWLVWAGWSLDGLFGMGSLGLGFGQCVGPGFG